MAPAPPVDMIEKYQDPRLFLQPFWQAGVWPDPSLPEEMVVRNLLALDDLYRTITAEELADFQAVVRRHPILSYSMPQEGGDEIIRLKRRESNLSLVLS